MCLYFKNLNQGAPDADDGRYLPNRVRVLHLLASFKPSGNQRQCVELVESLSMDRYELKLAALTQGFLSAEELSDPMSAVSIDALSKPLNLNTLRLVKGLLKFLKRERTSILHVHDFESAVIGSLAARLSRTPLIVSQNWADPQPPFLLGFGQKIITRSAIKILVNSEEVYRQLAGEGAPNRGKVALVRNGLKINRDIQQLRRTCREFIRSTFTLGEEALILGAIEPMVSGHDYFYILKALEKILQRNSNYHFVHIGEGPLQQYLYDQIGIAGLESQVHFLSQSEERPQALAGVDLALVLGEKNDIPITLIEAMGLGIPVVTMAEGSAVDLVKNFDTGFLVPLGNIDSLTDRIEYVLSRWDEAQMVGLRGRKHILNHFSIERMVKSVEQLYDEVLRN